MAIGLFPTELTANDVLENIDETVIIADNDFKIQWMNSAAVTKLTPLFQLYGFAQPEQVLGQHMNTFHNRPNHQIKLMNQLKHTHRTRITIKETYTCETVISPIYNEQTQMRGYLLMLLDVTTQAKEELEKQKIIEKLSSPVLKIWDNIIAVPILAKIDYDRADKLLHTILGISVKEQSDYILLDVSSLSDIDESTGFNINQISLSLHLIGAKCFIVGVSPELATKMANSHYKWETFKDVQQALQTIPTFPLK